MAPRVTLQWVSGKPSGPTKKIYYSTAEHSGGHFTLCVVYVGGQSYYELYDGKRNVMRRATKAECMAKAEEMANEV